jgi:phage gpG-like protein
VFQTGEDSRGIGTDVPYAKFHNFGTVNLPKREFIGITQSDTDLVQNILVTAVVKAFSSV